MSELLRSKYKILKTKVKMLKMKKGSVILSYKLKSFVLRCWMGQSAKQSRDLFQGCTDHEKGVAKKFQKKFLVEAF